LLLVAWIAVDSRLAMAAAMNLLSQRVILISKGVSLHEELLVEEKTRRESRRARLSRGSASLIALLWVPRFEALCVSMIVRVGRRRRGRELATEQHTMVDLVQVLQWFRV
jgi:hypothetical protein